LINFFIKDMLHITESKVGKAVYVSLLCYLFLQHVGLIIGIRLLSDVYTLSLYGYITTSLTITLIVIFLCSRTLLQQAEFVFLKPLPISNLTIQLSKVTSIGSLVFFALLIVQLPVLIGLITLHFNHFEYVINVLLLMVLLFNIQIVFLFFSNFFSRYINNTLFYFSLNFLLLLIVIFYFDVKALFIQLINVFDSFNHIDIRTIKEALELMIQHLSNDAVIGKISLFNIAAFIISLVSLTISPYLFSLIYSEIHVNNHKGSLSKKETRFHKVDFLFYFQREWLLMKHIPYYVLQMIMIFAFPIIISLIFGLFGERLLQSIDFEFISHLHLEIILLLLLLGAINNNLTATVFSREGEHFNQMEGLPYNKKTFVQSKFLFYCGLNLLAYTIGIIVLFSLINYPLSYSFY